MAKSVFGLCGGQGKLTGAYNIDKYAYESTFD